MNVKEPVPISALLGWCPRLLAAIAAQPRWVVPWCMGTAAAVAQTLIPTTTLAWLDEPFPDLATYFRRALLALPFGVIGLTAFWGCVFATIAAVGESRRYPRVAIVARLLCVCTLATIIPGTVWSICDFTSTLSLNLIPGQGPAWLGPPVIHVLGSPAWILVGLLVMFANVVAAYPIAKRALSTRDVRSCTKCGYNLTGNVSGVCPECGEIVLSSAAPRAEERNDV